MSVINRRNAVFGWLAWTVTKQALRSKTQSMVPGRDGAGRKVVVPAAALAAAIGGAVFFRRRQRDGEQLPD